MSEELFNVAKAECSTSANIVTSETKEINEDKQEAVPKDTGTEDDEEYPLYLEYAPVDTKSSSETSLSTHLTLLKET